MNVEKVLKEIDALIVDRDYKNAEKYLLRVMEKYPKHPEVHYLFADVYCKLGKFDMAVDHAKIAHKILPDNPQILNILGWAYFMNGEIPTGRKFMEQALKMTPDEVRLLCDLAVLELRDDNEKAYDYAKKALVLEPHDPLVRQLAYVVNLFMQSKERIKNKNKNKKKDRAN